MGRTGYHLLSILVVALLVFGGSATFGFVWDDLVLLVDNADYEELAPGKLFLSLPNGVEYLPFRDLSYVVDYALWGWNPLGFHLTNVVLYLLSLVALYFLTRRLTESLFEAEDSAPGPSPALVALVTTFLFAVHPLHSECVDFVHCRNVLLSGLFFFMSCHFYLAFLFEKKRLFYAAALVCFLIAIFSKATTIILPCILLLFLFQTKKLRTPLPLSLIPFFGLAAAGYLLFRAVAIESEMVGNEGVVVFGSLTVSSRLAVALQIPLFYIGKLIAPVGLSTLYSVEFDRALLSFKALASGAVLSLLLVIGVALRKRFPEALFALLWFLICLLPVLNTFYTSPVVADRYAYLSSFAFVYLLSVLLFRFAPGRSPRWVAAAAMAIVLVYAALSVARNETWRSEETLYSSMIRTAPEDPTGYENLAFYRWSHGQRDEALELFAKAKELNPLGAYSELAQGEIAFEAGRWDEAIAALKECVALKSYSVRGWYLLGKTYEKTGDIDLALESYSKVLTSSETWLSKERTHAEERLKALRRQLASRFERMRKKIEENPNDLNRRVELALALQWAGLLEEALSEFQGLLDRGGANWQLHYNMGLINRDLGRDEAAIKHFKQSLSSLAENPVVMNHLALLYQKTKQYDTAIALFEKAIEVDSEFSHAPFNLARLYFQLGDRENALRGFRAVQTSFPELVPLTAPFVDALE